MGKSTFSISSSQGSETYEGKWPSFMWESALAYCSKDGRMTNSGHDVCLVWKTDTIILPW